VFHDAPVLRGDALLLVVLAEAVVNLGGLPARLGQVILEEGDLVVVAEVLKQGLEGLLVDVMLLGEDLSRLICGARNLEFLTR